MFYCELFMHFLCANRCDGKKKVFFDDILFVYKMTMMF